MYNLEQACRIQLLAQSSGRPLILPAEAVARRTAAQYEADPDGAADLEWAALKRLAGVAAMGSA
jgi:hypothetical protein